MVGCFLAVVVGCCCGLAATTALREAAAFYGKLDITEQTEGLFTARGTNLNLYTRTGARALAPNPKKLMFFCSKDKTVAV